MGNRPTSVECFARLNVLLSQQEAFRQDVLDFLRERTIQDFTGLSRPKLIPLAKDYLRSGNFERWQTGGTTNGLSYSVTNDSVLQESLVQLIDIWADDKRKKESQEEPSWLVSASQATRHAKRRKTGVVTNPLRASVESTHQTDQQSATLALSPSPRRSAVPAGVASPLLPHASLKSLDDSEHESLHDIPYSTSSEVSLPEAAEIIRSSRRGSTEPNNVTEAHSTSDVVSRMHVQNSTRDTTLNAHVAVVGSPRPVNEDMSVTGTPRFASASCGARFTPLDSDHDGERSLRLRTMFDIENGYEASTTVRGISHATGTQALLTPPPTNRKLRRQRSEVQGSTGADSSGTCDMQQFRSVRNLLDDIVDYIDVCERYNVQASFSSSSSEKEIQLCRTRAATFASLKRDVESRIDAALSVSGDKEPLPVTSYCLWPYSSP